MIDFLIGWLLVTDDKRPDHEIPTWQIVASIFVLVFLLAFLVLSVLF